MLPEPGSRAAVKKGVLAQSQRKACRLKEHKNPDGLSFMHQIGLQPLFDERQ